MANGRIFLSATQFSFFIRIILYITIKCMLMCKNIYVCTKNHISSSIISEYTGGGAKLRNSSKSYFTASKRHQFYPELKKKEKTWAKAKSSKHMDFIWAFMVLH